MAGELRVVVLGYVVRGPLAGFAWHHLQYVLGLARLGHDVWFVEDSDDYPSCYDPEADATSADPSYGLRFLDDAFSRLGLGDRWAYHDAHTSTWHGRGADGAEAACRAADVVLNVSGVNPLRPWTAEAPVRVLVDTDPAFTQIRHLTDPAARERAAAHTAFATFGENLGEPDCAIPDDGFPWLPTRQPIALEAWPVTDAPADGPLTTVMQWESYPALEHDGRTFGMKSASFDAFAALPARTGETVELALGAPDEVRARLRAAGWRVSDARVATRDPWTYQRFIQRSKGELSVAKHGYASARTGWFSERSACYLASGRPVVVQDTGFSRRLGEHDGVLPFTTPDEAVEALAALGDRYTAHCAGAREAAEAHFAAERVLDDLLTAVLAADRA